MAPAKKASAKKVPAKRRSAGDGADITRALDALNDAIARAQSAATAVRTDLRTSPLRANLARDVERLVRDLRRNAGKLDRAVRADIRKTVGSQKSAAKKPAAKKPAAKKPAAKRAAAKKTAAKR